MVALNDGRNVGVNTSPSVVVSAVSGFKLGLPPSRPLYWFAGLLMILPYSAAVTPEFAQAAAEAEGVEPAHGSDVPSSSTRCCRYSSWMFGARTATLYIARRRTSDTGAHCRPIFQVFVEPNDSE